MIEQDHHETGEDEAPETTETTQETSPAMPDNERELRARLRVLLTRKLIEAVDRPVVRGSTLMAALRFLAETDSLDNTPPTMPPAGPMKTTPVDTSGADKVPVAGDKKAPGMPTGYVETEFGAMPVFEDEPDFS